MDRYESNGNEVATLDEGGFLAAQRDPAPPVQHWSYQIETPFRPVSEILEIVENEVGIEQEVWSASAEQVAFREAVLGAHIELRSRGGSRKPHKDLPESVLGQVLDTDIWMRSDAAKAAGVLLTDARKALAEAKASGDVDARRTRALGATSGYRSPSRQYELWRSKDHFPKYYARTQAQRSQAVGGEHGPAAKQIALKETAQWIAAPGFSNHNAGIAIDLKQFRTTSPEIRNSSNKGDLARWRASWFYKWLVANAANYGFQPYVKEPWHWEYKPSPSRDPEEYEDAGRFESESGSAAEGLDEGLDYAEESLESLDESQLDEYMSARDLEETELDESELAAEPETEEWFGMPFVPTAPAPATPPATAAPSRNPALVASCLPALKSIRSVEAFYKSRRGAAIDEIVLHDTSSARGRKFKDAVKYLQKPGDKRQVSIHYFIGREEGEIVSMVPEMLKAWHVAARGHNKRAVGIELFQREGEGERGVPAFTDWQYRAVSQLVYDLMLRHKVAPANVIAHAWVQSNRGDPKGFDWTRFGQMLGQIADCARGVDPNLVVADAASAGARGRSGTAGTVKEYGEELSDFGEIDFEEGMTDYQDEAGEELDLFEEEGFGDESVSEDGEGEQYDTAESLDEDRLLDETLDTEAPSAGVVDRVKTALEQKLWSGAAAIMIASGIGDEKQITNTIFRSRHPELGGRAIRPDEKALVSDWIAIRDKVVRPLLEARAAAGASGRSSTTATSSAPGGSLALAFDRIRTASKTLIPPKTTRAIVDGYERAEPKADIWCKQAGLTLDEGALSRMVASEVGSMPPQYKLGVIEAAVNEARAKGKSPFQLITMTDIKLRGGIAAKSAGYFGRQSGRWCASIQDPTLQHLEAVRVALAASQPLIARDARRWVDGKVMDKGLQAGKKLKYNAVTIVEKWGAEGWEWIGPVDDPNSGARLIDPYLLMLFRFVGRGKANIRRGVEAMIDGRRERNL